MPFWASVVLIRRGGAGWLPPPRETDPFIRLGSWWKMDKTRKLSALLGDDELLKQKALEYFTTADQSHSGTLSNEEVLEVRRSPVHTPGSSREHLAHARDDCCAYPDALIAPARASCVARSASDAASLHVRPRTRAPSRPSPTSCAPRARLLTRERSLRP